MIFDFLNLSKLSGILFVSMTVILSFVFLLSIVVFVHEFGHYCFAKLFKVKVETFSIGFGKKLFSKFDKSGTEWCVSLFPLGGYLKMHGESIIDVDENGKIDKIVDKDSSMLTSKTYLQKLLIVLGGPIFNFLLAFVILFLLYIFYPKIIVSNVVESINVSGIAYQNGIRKGDTITYVNEQKIKNMHDVNRMFMMNKNIDFNIVYESKSDKKENQFVIDKKDILYKEKNSDPILGLSGEISEIRCGFFDAMYYSAYDILKIVRDTAIVIKQIISIKRDSSELGGPIKIAKYSNEFFRAGLQPFLWFIAMVSINLGFMNLLPIPILDGGMAVFYTFQRIFGESISNSIFKVYYTIGVTFIILLTIFVSFNDVMFLFFHK